MVYSANTATNLDCKGQYSEASLFEVTQIRLIKGEQRGIFFRLT